MDELGSALWVSIHRVSLASDGLNVLPCLAHEINEQEKLQRPRRSKVSHTGAGCSVSVVTAAKPPTAIGNTM